MLFEKLERQSNLFSYGLNGQYSVTLNKILARTDVILRSELMSSLSDRCWERKILKYNTHPTILRSASNLTATGRVSSLLDMSASSLSPLKYKNSKFVIDRRRETENCF